VSANVAASSTTTITLALRRNGQLGVDLDFDKDGGVAVRALYVLVCAAWCAPCRQEAEALPRMFRNSYQPRGARFLAVMVQAETPLVAATRATVDAWVAAYHINHDIALGAAATLLANPAEAAFPTNYIIDPRTMIIQEVVQGCRPLDGRCLTSADCGTDLCDPLTDVCYPASLPGPLGGVDALLLRNGAPTLLSAW